MEGATSLFKVEFGLAIELSRIEKVDLRTLEEILFSNSLMAADLLCK
jgi:hypothetical protein